MPKEAIFCSALATSLRFYEDSFSIFTWSFIGSRDFGTLRTGRIYLPDIIERINEIVLRHNLVGNKIYKTNYQIGSTSLSPVIEIFDITKDGLINKSSRKIKAKSLPLKNVAGVLAMSYHPR